jgi:hypothetical protein
VLLASLPAPLFCKLSEPAICIVACSVAICVVFRLAFHTVRVVFRTVWVRLAFHSIPFRLAFHAVRGTSYMFCGSLGQWLGVALRLLFHGALLPFAVPWGTPAVCCSMGHSCRDSRAAAPLQETMGAASLPFRVRLRIAAACEGGRAQV